jgi:LmbE family N-acetylglucosaminyl deacetylase
MAEGGILVAVSHPDDTELSCAGTVAKWTAEGERAVLLVATDGARGGKHVGSERENMASMRRQEQTEAGALLGFEDVVFLGLPDGELEDTPQLRGALVAQLRTIRPQKVIILDPLTVILQNSYVNHRDHRVFGTAMLDAMYPEASNAGYFPDQLEGGLKLHKVPEVLLAISEQPNYWVDVSQTLERRFDALRCHRSQIRLWPDEGESIIRQQREQARTLGAEHGMRYAEEFRRVVVNPLT